jgi:class 3 adenylate cyclase
MADLAACILFTDLVGSTELLSGLGEAAFDKLRRAHFAALRSAIERLLATTLERYDEAGRHFAAAEAGHAHVGAPTWLARTRLEWARMLLCRRADGDAERARELLAAALATARELGLGSIERQGAALAGGGPAR